MFHFKVPNMEYVLPLDSLDLHFLSEYVERSSDEKRLIWSKTFMNGESTYCQVKIIPDESCDDESYLEPSETSTCHICNITVPQKYFKRHIKSKMHQNSVKLTKKVLENLSNQLYIDNTENNNEYDNNMFYCESCCKIIAVINKQKHYKSKYHLNSKENEKITDSFLKIYIKDKVNKSEKVETQFLSENNNMDTIKSDSEYNTFLDAESFSEIEDVAISNNLISNNSTVYKPAETVVSDESDDEILPNSGTEISHFLLYLKEMISKYKLQLKIPAIEDNCIVVVTPKGCKEKVTIDAFHSYERTSCFVFCQLCKICLMENIDQHSTTEEHVKNIIQPVNENFCRELVIDRRLSHCLVCNDIVLTNSVHRHCILYNQARTSKPIESPVIANKSSVNSDVNPNMTFCDICKIHTDNYLTHIISKKHKNKLKRLETNSTTATASTSTLSTATTSTNDGVQRCDICNVLVPKYGMALHEVGKPHKTKVLNLSKTPKAANKMLVDNNLPSTSKVTPPTMPPQKSNQSLTMEQKMNVYKKQMDDFDATSMTCLVCKLKVPNLPKNIIEHVEGTRHRNAMDVLLLENKIVKISNNLHRCEFCKDNVVNFIDHIFKNTTHIQKAILIGGTIDKVKLKEYVHDDPLNNTPLATAYRQIYTVLLEQNKVVRLNNLIFHCNVCLIRLTRISEIDHIFGGRHKSCLNTHSS